ncbi:conserved Plasmodium protein, unknown function [Plasmodium knowlesi strain H]|uniref:Uncharacterized protein n=3 Tax=Plasmodium knowlesi TaxID=5850 RepID=A0A5K1UCF9_PLAKH|nr:conserved Plasmodium protein, unknown function [Plasmodium knowlesi strain H]OTN66572.1 Uncharacterized protein PKNOH_S08477500 [Plasmodium knowlesi]CAA9990100.1 conserved Plasmodium protein, unknown function [Plasmodium knowlesi strain H]SBO25772.1 conserved Plasmodium protein, unknown function [Plasmodium knowlesi strain H]SBO28571.1 conserved Plasmodium protein, unknown function [Plasmodium knowlesi strain H]VVS79574.1 conserved Plasmodium protein, unknown function [Plasmodium knowlesi s|eukprot:XP_002260566.1 hypothetical protein, conserved in Plasmodium species [Plasmodium knowlesi strain H]
MHGAAYILRLRFYSARNPVKVRSLPRAIHLGRNLGRVGENRISLPKRPLTANFFRQEQNYELGQGEDDDDVDIFKNDGDEMGGGGEAVNSAAIAPDVANVRGNRVGGSADGEDEADGDDSDDDGSDDDGSGSSSASGMHTEGRRKEQYGKDGNKRVQQDGSNSRNLFYSKKLPDTGKVGTENRSNKDSLTENVFKDTYDECYPGY